MHLHKLQFVPFTIDKCYFLSKSLNLSRYNEEKKSAYQCQGCSQNFFNHLPVY